MKVKNTILITLFLLSILTISAVSAASDDNNTLTSSDVNDNTLNIDPTNSNNAEQAQKDEDTTTTSDNNNDIVNLENDNSQDNTNPELGTSNENIKSTNPTTPITASEEKTVKADPDKPFIYIASDKLVNTTADKAFLEAIKKEIGDKAIVVIDPNSPNPGEVERAIKNAGKGIAAYISNFCAGTTYGLVQYDMRGYLNAYSTKLDGVCFVYYGTIPVATTDYIARAWDDNFSDPYFAGLYSPYKYITDGGLGFIWARANGDTKVKMVKTIADGLVAYAKAAQEYKKTHTPRHLSYDNVTEIIKYVAYHDISPASLANDANKILSGKNPSLDVSKWLYYTAQYVGALPITNTIRIFKLPKTISASTFTKSTTLSRINYRTLALQIKEYMDKYGAAPAYVTYNKMKINFNDYCYMLAQIIKKHTDKTKFVFANSITLTKSPINIINLGKKTTKLVAAKKTFKRRTKTKKYTVTLKYKKGIKNGKLTLKINGRTYTAKTNKNGKATFKITKLTKRGKYTATIKFAGSKLYKASTLKVKITIK